MLDSNQVEELICLVAEMDRCSIEQQFLSFRGSFPVDLSPQFLERLPLDRLRHIYVALCLQSQKVPTASEAVVA